MSFRVVVRDAQAPFCRASVASGADLVGELGLELGQALVDDFDHQLELEACHYLGATRTEEDAVRSPGVRAAIVSASASVAGFAAFDEAV